jgi:hypothetical protein
MVSRADPKPRRRARSVAQAPATKPSSMGDIGRIALSPRTVYYVLGTLGLAALAVALIGPSRLERKVFKPLRGAIEPQAEKLWADSQPLREQIAGLFKSAAPGSRERLVRSFQSWIGHFHAS